MTDIEKFQKALASMRMAQRQWADTPLRDRCQIVAAIGRTFGERATEVADLVRTETKKTALDDSRNCDVISGRTKNPILLQYLRCQSEKPESSMILREG